MLRETGSFVKPSPYVLFSTRLKIVGYIHKKFLCHPDLLLSSPPPYLRLTRDLVSNRGDLTFPPPPHFPCVHFPHPSFDSQWKVKTIFSSIERNSLFEFRILWHDLLQDLRSSSTRHSTVSLEF